jgi:hypothetical protein
MEATDAAGNSASRDIQLRVVEREFDKFPGWSRVDVTTGWITAAVDGQTAVDARIQTDPERFWDYYQAKALPRIYDNVMKVTENRPLPDKQPFHRDLDIEVWMSEPDFRIGVDEELVSSLEALHEDLYFVTLDFFDALADDGGRRLAAPGKITRSSIPSAQASRARRGSRRGQRVDEGVAAGELQDQGERSRRGHARPRGGRDAARRSRVVARADRLSEIELQVEAKDDAAAAGRPMRSTAWPAARGRPTDGVFA